MLKFIKRIALGIILLFSLSFFGYLVYRATTLGATKVPLGKQLLLFVKFPDKIKDIVKQVNLSGIPETYTTPPTNFTPLNNLPYNLFGLSPIWDTEEQTWRIDLLNFKNNDVSHSWTLNSKDADLSSTYYQFSRAMPRNPILLDNYSIIADLDESANLYRLDSNSKIMWHNKDYIFHHGMNLAYDSTIWICGSTKLENGKNVTTKIKTYNNQNYQYTEEFLVHIDPSTGITLEAIPLTQLLIDNNLLYLAFAAGDPDVAPTDNLHLNDIQPTLTTSKYWDKGDLFVSIRHKSCILLVSKDLKTIKKVFQGPFLAQHDVEIVNDSTISFFNNNFINIERDSLNCTSKLSDFELSNSEVLFYDFSTNKYSSPYSKFFKQEQIQTISQGMSKVLHNGDLWVESQNQSTLYVLDSTGFKLKYTLPSQIEGHVSRPHWIRIVQNLELKK